jgi:glutathione S-transferase
MTHYGWLVSPFSAKTRGYLRYTGLPFTDVEPNVVRYMTTVRSAVGRPIMPTVRLADGRWLQDSSDIIDHVQASNDVPSVTPPGPSQRVASALVELLADEWLPMAAIHFRWNTPGNATFAIDDFARSGLPFLPRVVGRPIMRRASRHFRNYRSILGVSETTIPGIEDTITELIACLQQHLSHHPYLLGSRPCIGDFALMGPLWAHIWRDPDTRPLFDDAPLVTAWMERVHNGESATGDWVQSDEVPATLDPLFALIADDVLPWMRTVVDAIDAYCDDNPEVSRVPRSLGAADFHIRGRQGKRKIGTFTQYKLQRVTEHLSSESTTPWLSRFAAAVPKVRHPFTRTEDFQTVLVSCERPTERRP